MKQLAYVLQLIFYIGIAYLVGSLIEGSLTHWGKNAKICMCIWFVIIMFFTNDEKSN